MEKDLSFGEMKKVLNASSYDDLNTFNLTILRNIVLDPIETPAKYFARQSGLRAEIVFGEYDNVFQDSLDSKKIAEGTDAVLIVTPLHALSPKLASSFSTLSETDVIDECAYVKEFISSVLANIRTLNREAYIFMLSFESPYLPSMGIHDWRMARGQLRTIEELNADIALLAGQFSNTYCLNANQILNKIGGDDFYDWRYWHVARALYSRQTLIGVSRLLFDSLDILLGKTKKCLVLDCDNTLWGGVVGEDSLSGIKLGSDYPGSCYLAFQEAVLELYHQGVIIALCSKNNEEDVVEVFDNHPAMLIKLEHIAVKKINWIDKVSNLQDIAMQLNLSVDSLVFVDDSRYEIELVESKLPQVRTLWLDNSESVVSAQKLRSLRCFDKMTLTDEDRKRGKMYQAHTKRVEMTQATNIDDYLSSLNMQVSVFLSTPVDIPRLAQQTQKTNQFNLSTKRYTENDIRSFIDSQEFDVVAVKVKDRFGDLGIVGTAILQYLGRDVVLDTFLLSCRALGRKLEFVFLNEILAYCKRHRRNTLTINYVPTRKNVQVREFLIEYGLGEAEAEDQDLRSEIQLNIESVVTLALDSCEIDNSGLHSDGSK